MSKRRGEKTIPLQIHTREFVEQIAKVMGPFSAAQAALREADERGGEVVFASMGSCWYVINKEELNNA